MEIDFKEVRVALNNFRYNLRNAPSFRKEFRDLKALLSSIVLSSIGEINIEKMMQEMERLLAGKSNSKVLREEALKKLEDIEGLMIQQYFNSN